MKIENEVIEFHKLCPFNKFEITDLHQQYLTDLRHGKAIQELVQSYLSQGWLVNFQVLYELIEKLTLEGYVLNSSFLNYFQKINIEKNFTSSEEKFKTLNKGDSYKISDLKKLPFIRSLPERLSNEILQQSVIKRVSAETLICKQGDINRDLYILLSGEAAIYKKTNSKRQFIAVLNEGSVFGEAGFLLGHVRSADVILTRQSDVLVVPYQESFVINSLNTERAQSLIQRFWVLHALLHSDLLSRVPEDCFEPLISSGQLVDLLDQQVLFEEDTEGNEAYVLIQGKLQIIQKGKIINKLIQGAFLGEISLLASQGRRTATVIADGPSKLLRLRSTDFYRLLAFNLCLAKEIQGLASHRLGLDYQRDLIQRQKV